MRKLIAAAAAVLVIGALVPRAIAQEAPDRTSSGTTYVEITPEAVTIGNALVERSWTRTGWATTSFTDKRTGEGVTGGGAPDFTLDIGTTETISSDVLQATNVSVSEIPGGLRADVTLTPAAGAETAFTATRTIEIYDGIAGLRTQTTLSTLAPLVLRGYSLEQANVGTDVTPTIHAFRAGADWREPDWAGPGDGQFTIGDPHAGTWRDTDTAAAGTNLAGPAQWISTGKGDHSLFMVMERNDWPSSRAAYTDGVAKLNVDYSADVVLLGPLEESGHIENPQAGTAPGRHRVIEPTAPYTMESVFVGFGANPDDEPWQFHKYLTERRMPPIHTDVTFNSNGTDADVRSDGAKDDMVEEIVAETAPIARRLGIETFILDDGWQARSGDWEPDCGTVVGEPNTDPRWDGTEATAKFARRFTDCDFTKVREHLGDMELGLWMNAMHFHPRAHTYMNNPQWGCTPVGHATGATSIVQPNGGSNDAGIGTWSTHPDLMAHVESKIQRAISEWGVTYFKFDFLVWLDCAGQGDLYDYKEAFMAMLDRLIERNPEVTFQIDETNDYRLFPFESVSRGPSWFQNGSPPPERLLHNLWNLSPYVPTYTLGQHFLGGNQYRNYSVDTLMAIALPGHLTFFSDLRHIPLEVVDQARPWIDFYKAHRSNFTQMTYPLLADPMKKSWTALQTWNPDDARGALLAFRQDATDATRTIALRNVPDGMTFDLFEAPTGNKVGTVTSAELQNGLEISIPSTNAAKVLLIEPAADDPFDPATTLTYTGDTTGRIRKAVTLAATLTGSDGPIAGAPITFEFRGVTYTAITDAAGVATVTTGRLTGKPGSFVVTAAYPGSDRYSPSQTQATIQLTR